MKVPSRVTSRRVEVRSGLPPVTRLTSTVWPVVKSNTRAPGVTTIGPPLCWKLGAAWSRVWERITVAQLVGRQLPP